MLRVQGARMLLPLPGELIADVHPVVSLSPQIPQECCISCILGQSHWEKLPIPLQIKPQLFCGVCYLTSFPS